MFVSSDCVHPTQLVSGVVSEVGLHAHQAASSKTLGIRKYAFSSEEEHAKAKRLIRGKVTYGSCKQGYSTWRENQDEKVLVLLRISNRKYTAAKQINYFP